MLRRDEFFLEEGRVKVAYIAIFREYAIKLRSGAIQLIYYCPWCGVKLPKSLRDKYFDELEKLGYGDLAITFELQELIDIEPNNEWLVKKNRGHEFRKVF